MHRGFILYITSVRSVSAVVPVRFGHEVIQNYLMAIGYPLIYGTESAEQAYHLLRRAKGKGHFSFGTFSI